jgi:hypothetical protein
MTSESETRRPVRQLYGESTKVRRTASQRRRQIADRIRFVWMVIACRIGRKGKCEWRCAPKCIEKKATASVTST